MITIALLLNAYFVWSTGLSLERRLLEMRAAGHPIGLADLGGKPIPPEQNAEACLRLALDDLDAIQKELLALYPKQGYTQGPLSADEQAKLQKLFSVIRNVVPQVEQAAACPNSDLELDVSLPTARFLQPYMDRTAVHRVLNRVIRTRTSLLISHGRYDEALASQLVLLRLTRQWRREPLIFSYLVTGVCELGGMEGINDVLQTGPVSPPARQALDAELGLHDTMEGYDEALVTERAYALSSFREIPGSGFWLLRGFQNRLAINLIDLIDRYRQKSPRPFAEVITDQKERCAGVATEPVRFAHHAP